MRAGRLRHRVTIQEKSVSQNSFGEEVITWTDVKTVWASIEPLRGREYIELRQAQADVTTRIRMRHYPDIVPSMRLAHGDRVFEIVSPVKNVAERDIQDEVMCKDLIDG
jgi:SPP1 family predicted phage head-tail adaptor